MNSIEELHKGNVPPDSSGGNAGDVLQDFWQATLDLQSHLAQAEEHQQFDVRVPVETLKNLLDGVEAIRKVQSIQEKHSVTSLYVGTSLGALIGIIGNFFVTLWFQRKPFRSLWDWPCPFGCLCLCVRLSFFSPRSTHKSSSLIQIPNARSLLEETTRLRVKSDRNMNMEDGRKLS